MKKRCGECKEEKDVVHYGMLFEYYIGN